MITWYFLTVYFQGSIPANSLLSVQPSVATAVFSLESLGGVELDPCVVIFVLCLAIFAQKVRTINV